MSLGNRVSAGRWKIVVGGRMTVTLAMRVIRRVTGCSLHCQLIVFQQIGTVGCDEDRTKDGDNKTMTMVLRWNDNCWAMGDLRSD